MFRKSKGGKTASSKVSVSAWRSAVYDPLHAIEIPLPGFAELQHGVRGLIDGVKMQGYNDEQCTLLLTRVERLMHVLHEFGEPQYLDFTEISRKLLQIKEIFENESKRQSRIGILGAEQRQCLLDNLRDEVNGLVEETQLRMLSRSVQTKNSPIDNFPTRYAHEITRQELLSRSTLPGRPTSKHIDQPSGPAVNPDGAVVVSTHHGQLGKLSVVYKTYCSNSYNGNASKVAEEELKRLSSSIHENIASVIGITKGYYGINGFIVAMGGIPLEQFLSYVDTGVALVKCLRGLQDSDITVGLDGHPTVYPSFDGLNWGTADTLLQIRSRSLDSVGRFTVDVLSGNWHSSESNVPRFIDSVASLGLMRFTKLEVARIASECKALSSIRVARSWRSRNHPPHFTIGLGDVGRVLRPPAEHFRVWHEEQYSWDSVEEGLVHDIHHSTTCSGWRFKRHARETNWVTGDQWYSYALCSCEEVFIRWECDEFFFSFCDYAMHARLAVGEYGSGMDDTLHYCCSLSGRVIIYLSESSKNIAGPLYFHRNPSSRSNIREFWGFVSSNPDPRVSTPESDELLVRVAYSVRYNTFPVTDTWEYKYQKMLRSNLASIPGGYPGPHLEEIEDLQ